MRHITHPLKVGNSLHHFFSHDGAVVALRQDIVVCEAMYCGGLHPLMPALAARNVLLLIHRVFAHYRQFLQQETGFSFPSIVTQYP